MGKPILIDALHICMGGGLMILNHLVTNLVERKVDFFLLKDDRCPRLEAEDRIERISTLAPAMKARKAFYKQHRNDFSKVLCFGNIPPPIKMPVPAYTYIHNVSLLKIPKDYSLRRRALSWLKKQYIRSCAKNTDAWIVQTSNTRQLVKDNLASKNQPILEYPFFCIPEDINSTPKDQRCDYCFIGDYTSAKGHEYLVDAWVKLAHMGFSPTLHLTVSKPIFLPQIATAQENGANIVNHGKISFMEVVDIYNLSKAIVYPSINESLGLGIVEGLMAGCDILGSDLPYLHAVCVPSRAFKPCDSDAIVDVILSYENSPLPKSTLLIEDQIDAFLDFLIG